MKYSVLEQLEIQELIQKLRNAGYGELVDVLMTHEEFCYTKKGRLNKCGACRQGGWKTKELEDMLLSAREVLQDEIGD